MRTPTLTAPQLSPFGTEKMAFEFECDCTARTLTEFRPPGDFDKPVYHDFHCRGRGAGEVKGCGSTWQLRIRRSFGRLIATHRLLRGSSELEKVLLDKKVKKILNQPQKKAPQFFIP